MKRVVPSEIQRFCKECLEVAGASTPHAASLAAVLAQADQMGYLSHGLNTLAIYVQDVQLKLANGAAMLSIIKETTATAWVEGKYSNSQILCSSAAIYVQGVQLKLADGAAMPSFIKETTATAWVDGKYSNSQILCSSAAIYVQDVQLKLTDGAAMPSIIKETTATAWVDGKNALGPVVGNFCMDVAIKKAKDCGIGWIVAKGSNQYGVGSWYSTQALKHNMLGMAFSNTPPLVPPTRSEKNAMGTNPLSVAAPAMDGDSFVLDMATSTAAVGVSEISKKKKEKAPLQDMQDNYQPLGSFGSLSAPMRSLKLTHKKLSIEAKKTTQKPNPMALPQVPDEKSKDNIFKLAWEIKNQMPLGGDEMNSGYKGYGLALMVETFCGILAGGDFGPNIREWTDAKRPANLAQCFVVINPTHFAPEFEQRMSEMNRILRNMEPLHPDKPVLVPGDPERKYMEKVNKEGGVFYTEDQLTVAAQLAAKLQVAPLKFL